MSGVEPRMVTNCKERLLIPQVVARHEWLPLVAGLFESSYMYCFRDLGKKAGTIEFLYSSVGILYTSAII